MQGDCVGRLRAPQGSALAALLANRFDRDAVQRTVTAAVASGWVLAVTLQERIGIAVRNHRSVGCAGTNQIECLKLTVSATVDF